MTGFGRGEGGWDDLTLWTEIRSLNHRHLEFVVKLPRLLAGLEDPIRREVQGRVGRGRVEITLHYAGNLPGNRRVKLDLGLAREYLAASRVLKEELCLPGTLDLVSLCQWAEIFAVEEEDPDLQQVWGGLQPALEQALENLVEMRVAEGEELRRSLEERLQSIAAYLASIKLLAPEVVESYHTALQKRIEERLKHLPVDRDRLAQEVAVFAERCSIDEELVRLDSHLDQFRSTLEQEEEPVGRKLEFILQEMGREVNTIGSKGNSAGISRHVVEIKSEMEKIREQVQNIE